MLYLASLLACDIFFSFICRISSGTERFFLYGISFTALISPFAVLPRPLGMVFWCLVNCGFLYYAISKLDLKKWQFAVVILVSVNDVFTAVLSQQYSIGITAMIIFSYVLIEKEKDFGLL